MTERFLTQGPPYHPLVSGAKGAPVQATAKSAVFSTVVALVVTTLGLAMTSACVSGGRRHTTLDLAPIYTYVASDSSFRQDRHDYGVTARLHYNKGDGLIAGMILGLSHSEYPPKVDSFSGTPESDHPSAQSMAAVGPYIGMGGSGLSFEFGLHLWLSVNDEELRLFPIPWLTMRFGPQDSAWFEVITGPERGVFDGLVASLGAGFRLGEREEFLFRFGIGMMMRFQARGSDSLGPGFDVDVVSFPLGGFAELTWTSESGVGLYTRVVGAFQPTFAIGIALDLETLGGH